ncbi:MAG TPA: hypothetical protein VG477_13465 [Thermoanaerobaculia bacterium]|nr:hypothetical protein [Thermoanaerobaculia bacterium]
MEVASRSTPGLAMPLAREEKLWAALALGLSVLEAPIVYLVWRGLGPILLAYPRAVPGPGGDVYVDLALTAAGFFYLGLWAVMFLGMGALSSPAALGRLWGRSFLVLLAAGVHTLAHFATPWFLIVTDRAGITSGAALSLPSYLNLFQPSFWRFLELPALILGFLLVSQVSHRRRGSSKVMETK